MDRQIQFHPFHHEDPVILMDHEAQRILVVLLLQSYPYHLVTLRALKDLVDPVILVAL